MSVRMRNNATFSLTITMDSDAFCTEACGDNAAGWETARILRRLANELEDGGEVSRALRDFNGNVVGSVEVEDE